MCFQALRNLALVLSLSVAVGSAAFAQPSVGARSGTSGTMLVSAAAKVTYVIRNVGKGDVLELIIVWRGTPGWFATGGSSGSSGGGGGNVWRHRFWNGGHELEAGLDFSSRMATIQGHEVKLGDANVILVDGVDSAEGPRVVRTLTIDARLGTEPGPAAVFPVLGRSREIRDYLRCDTQLPDPTMQERIAPVCERILSQ